MNFSTNPYLDQDFTADVNLLERALRQVSMQGSTALYDAIVASETHLRNNPRLEKKALLVITDGKDNMSRETLQEAQRALQGEEGLADATGGAAFFRIVWNGSATLLEGWRMTFAASTSSRTGRMSKTRMQTTTRFEWKRTLPAIRSLWFVQEKEFTPANRCAEAGRAVWRPIRSLPAAYRFE